ncbi:MAG: ABC-2 transporter permease [Gemmatimonadota bacterium]|nr:MAG: ABC-2 transporter permease [Gemmatimonadota bacterium]
MLSLVWKDVVAARWLLLLVIPLGAVELAVMSFTPAFYVIAVLTFSALLALGSIPVEEYQRTELLWNSLPVSRGAFVTARYLTALVGMVAGLALGWALAQAVTRLASSAADGPAALLGLDAHAVMFGVLAFSVAAFLPLYFRFGAGRSLLFFSAIAVAALLVVSLLAQLILSAEGYPSPISDPEAWRTAAPALMTQLAEWLTPRFWRLLTLFVGAAVIAMGVSLLISRRLYEARDL